METESGTGVTRETKTESLPEVDASHAVDDSFYSISSQKEHTDAAQHALASRTPLTHPSPTQNDSRAGKRHKDEGG